MADTIGGLGGLFSGLSQGLQMLYALQRADAEQALRAREQGVRESSEARAQQEFESSEADKPYKDIQSQLNKANVTAALPDIQREYTPPAVADTYQPTKQLKAPAFGTSG